MPRRHIEDLYRLQWGRDFNVAESIALGLWNTANSHASMGPRL